MGEAKRYTPEEHITADMRQLKTAALLLELEASVKAMMSRLSNAENLIATLVVNCRKGGDPKAICEFIARVDVPAYLDGQGVKMLPEGENVIDG